MFQKFGKEIPQSLVDAVSGIMSEAKADEPAAPDADAIARRKRLQAIKDKQEDDAAERGTGEKKTSNVRVHKGTYGTEYKGDMEEETCGCDTKKEELIGGQKKLDKNHNGKLDADDFKKLRKEDTLNEKAVSVAQQKFMGMVNAVKKGKMKAPSAEVSKAASGMTKKAAHDYAATKHKGLPQHKEEVEQVVEYAGQPKDVPFDADKPTGKKIAVAGKSGYGPSAARQLARQGLKKFLKKETMMGKAPCNEEEIEEASSATRAHKILATKLKQIDKMSQGTAPDSIENKQTIKDKMKDAGNIGKVEIVTQKDTSIRKEEFINEGAESDFHPDVHAELKKHTGKIGAIMHNTKDNAIAAVVHHPDAEGIHGPHHVHFFINNKKVHTSVHPTFGDAEQHAVHTVTSKSGLKHLGKMHKLMEGEQISELSKPMLATYIRRASDPSHPKSNVNLSSLAAHKLASGDEKDDGEKEDRKAYHRSRGIGLAAAKMAREETEQVEEVFSDADAKAQRDATIDRAWKAKSDMNTKKYLKNLMASKKRAAERSVKKEGASPNQDTEDSINPTATARGH